MVKDGYYCCDMCGESGKDIELSFSLSRSQLLFGGFRGKMIEYRCKNCEKKVFESVTSMINSNLGTKKNA